MGTDRLRTSLIFLAYAYAALLPFSIAMGSILSGALIVGGLALFAMDPSVRANLDRPMLVVMAGLILWLALATATAPGPVKWEDWGELLWLKLHVFTAAAIFLGRPRHVERVLVLFVTSAVIVGILGIGQHFTGRLFFEHEIPPMRGDLWEIEGYFGHHLTYGGHVMVMWVVAFALVAGARSMGHRWRSLVFSTGALGVLSLALFWSYARSPQIGAIGGAIALATTLPRRARFVVAAVLALAVVSAIASPQMRERFGKVGDLTTEETRLNLWESSLRGIQERPWTGYGPGNFGVMLRSHEVEGFYNARSHAHNDWIQHAVVMGVPGLAFAVAFFVTIALALRRRLGSRGFPSWIVPAAFAALMGIALAGMFQVFDSDDEVEMTLFFVIGCALSATACTRGSSSPDPGEE